MFGKLIPAMLKLSLLMLSLPLSGCGPIFRVQSPGVGPIPSEDGKPPAVTIIVNGREQVGTIGTYCWPQIDESTLCTDMIGLLTPVEPLGANSPLTIRFRIPMDRPPTRLNLQVVAVSPEDEMRQEPLDGVRAWEPKPGDSHLLANSLTPSLNLELEPGLYIFTLFAGWDGVGDAMHGFLVEVQ